MARSIFSEHATDEEYGRNCHEGLAASPKDSLVEPLLLECHKPDTKLVTEEEREKERPPSNENNDVSSSSEKRSKNIPLVLAYTFVTFAGRSMWSQSVLSAFVYLLGNDNPESVGFLTAVMGVAQLLASFPSGMLADMYRRDVMLKVGSLFGVTAIVTTIIASFIENFATLGVALALWGVFIGITNTSISALFADSIPDGKRSHYFTQRMMLTKLGCTTGPTASLIMFAILGNNWTTKDCATVMIFGQAICLSGIIILCFLSDRYTVGHNDNSSSEMSSSSKAKPSSNERSGTQQNLEHGTEQPKEEPQKDFLCLSGHRVVPVLVTISDVMAGCAAGMSTRYFTIFFIDNLKLSPSIVSLLGLLSPLGQMVLHKLAHIGGQKIGRCQMVVCFKWIGISSMIAMILSYNHQFHAFIVCIFFLLRTFFMNATSNLTKSVIMDSVPRNERGKWSALESVNTFSWSGSAALGGVLVGSEGIIFNFYVTAALQFVATLPLLLLFKRVKD